MQQPIQSPYLNPIEEGLRFTGSKSKRRAAYTYSTQHTLELLQNCCKSVTGRLPYDTMITGICYIFLNLEHFFGSQFCIILVILLLQFNKDKPIYDTVSKSLSMHIVQEDENKTKWQGCLISILPFLSFPLFYMSG